MEQNNNTAYIRRLGSWESFTEAFDGLRELANSPQYSRLPMETIADIFGRAWLNNPYVQNTRLKGLRSAPIQAERKDIEEMLKNAQSNERGLRQVGIGLNFASYPFYKLKKTISTILTYKWYYMPQYISDTDAADEQFLRERKFVDKFCKRLDPFKHGRIITQQTLDEGKIFRYMRFLVDKSSNNVYGVDLQELPSDYCKIVGRNSDSYYTVAFDFTYFWQPGTSVSQFDPIFKDYYMMLMGVTDSVYKYKKGGKVINMAKAAAITRNNPEISIEKINGRYFFWVNLPQNCCFTFGTDFSSPIQAPMLMGLFLTGADLSQYEYLQKQLLQVPLYAILTGEIPYHDERQGKGGSDDIRLSPTGYTYYQSLFYEMLSSNDTTGVDLFAAPFENIKLQSLDSTPNSTDIVTKAYQDFDTKAGVSGIMSTTDKPMAALVASTQKIESQYAVDIYAQFANMMNRTFERLNLKYSWRFVMFGDIFLDDERLRAAKEGMTLGILSDTYIYNALCGRTIEDDIAASREMIGSGLLEMRRPLQTSYTASGKDGGDNPVGGRPKAEVTKIRSEKTEQTIDYGDGDGL